jgi:hypothetical protein
VRRDASGRSSRLRELEDVVERTGGTVLRTRSGDDIRTIVKAVARTVRQQYTIAYAPLNQALDGTYRSVRVKVASSDECGFGREQVTSPPRSPSGELAASLAEH